MSEPGFVNLRGDANNSKFVAAARSVLGQDLPLEANTMSIDKHHVYWLGPDEWLIVTAGEDSMELLTELRRALAKQHTAVTDVSGGNILLRLSGDNAHEILANGCTMDFHTGVFPIGHCAQSGLAKALVLIGHIDERPTYEIIVRRSFSEYLSHWLHAAGNK